MEEIDAFDHPVFAVTAVDGRFTIDRLPPGEYELEAWHPTLGTHTQRIRVPEAGTTDLSVATPARGRQDADARVQRPHHNWGHIPG